MSTITRRFTITATRESPLKGVETITLGRATEWDGEGILIELDVLPCGNWWGGTATLREEGQAGSGQPSLGRQYDLMMGKPSREPGGKKKWIRIGAALELGGELRLDFSYLPAGAWWDGKLRLFVRTDKPKGNK